MIYRKLSDIRHQYFPGDKHPIISKLYHTVYPKQDTSRREEARMKGKNKVIPLVAICILTVTSIGIYAAIMYMKSTPASVTVSENSWMFDLFEDEACTIPLTTIQFPIVVEEPYSGDTTTVFDFYLEKTYPGGQIYNLWYLTENLPADFTLVVKFDKNDGFGWDTWTEGQAGQIQLGNPLTILHIEMTLDVDAVANGNYGFNIEIYTEN